MDTTTNAGAPNGRSGDVYQLYRLMTAHWEAGALMAAVRLDIFTHMAGGSCTAASLAVRCGAQAPWMEKLLVVCTALGLIIKTGAQYQNAPLAEKFLVKTSPLYQGDLA